ncbi:MAG: type II toxin-antitoxin system RelE/ParE family toxin [Polyangiaceae bacterium]
MPFEPPLPVLIDPEALNEGREAIAWYEERNPRAAERFQIELEHVIERITKMPHSFPETEQGVRRASLSRFPYSVLFAVEGESLIILAIAHNRRQVGYWHDRR